MIDVVVQWYRRWCPFADAGRGNAGVEPVLDRAAAPLPESEQPALLMEDARAHAAPDVELQRRLGELAIGFDGRQYTYASYKYDRLDDAVRYAELVRGRQAHPT
ncbi:hypothetical protein [Xenophilus azovorans]|uniref:hypothetical protein n=1 Tax=Xenophilus azovorans TaxID=151755 RepID=UPI0012ED7A85|nr:hypothetical protein [Xenophilus azovorans]